MNNYFKGKNVAEELELSRVPIPNIPEGVTWMHVKPGSKVRNLIEYALKSYGSGTPILWSGAGAAVNKTITCAEITKRNFPDAHQFNKIAYIRCQEFWYPKTEGLDKLVVNRDSPCIHILLSQTAINLDLPGYQAPGKTPQGKPTRRPPYNANKGKRKPYLQKTNPKSESVSSSNNVQS